MTLEKLDHLEDRIQKPGYLLLLVVVLLVLIVGLVDLIDHISRDPVLFGRYSISYFGLVVVYFLGVLAWSSLLFRPNDDYWLTKSLDYIQQHPLLAIGILVVIGLVLAALIVPRQKIHGFILSFPALQLTIFVTLLLAAGLILFHDWDNAQLWRKVVVFLLAILLVVELIIQTLAFFGLLPTLSTTTDSFAPYTRVYQSDEGLGNGIANKYGRYAPEFELLPDSRRIAIVGDTFIQALQVKADQNLGVILQNSVNENAQDELPVEILTLGYPDYGPGMYLSNWMLNVAAKEFEPEEMIVFFDIGSDFQTVDGPGYGVPYFEYVGQGRVSLNLEAFFTDLHDAEHAVYQGHEGFQLVRAIGSHYFTPRIAINLLQEPQVKASEAISKPNSDIDLANGFVFHEETNNSAMLIAEGLIQMAQEQLARADIGMKLVTVPVFTEAFYDQETWNTRFGESDLLLPERELRTFAENNSLPFMSLGTYMAAMEMTPEDVQKLYYKDGLGNFTPEGHEFAAEAVYQCFFAQTVPAEAGCDLR